MTIDTGQGKIERVQLRNSAVEINWSGTSRTQLLSLFWLRDHCQEADSQHPVTRQRLVNTFEIPADIRAQSVELESGGQAIRVHWAGSERISRYSSGFLMSLRPNPDVLPQQRTLWDAATFGATAPNVPFEPFLAQDAVLQEMLEKVMRFGLCFVEGVPGTPEATRAVATRITYIRETIFGGYWDFTANMEHKDTAYTSMAIGPHTDGTYSFDAPGYQMFHCLAAECTGGENILIDGFKIAQLMRRDQPELYKVLTQVAIPGQYLDHERGVHLMARRPLFRVDDSGDLAQVTFNNYDRAPFVIPAEVESTFYRALGAFDAHCNDPALHYRRRLLPGSVLLFDNWRVLHARDAYTGYRRLAGVYLNKEDVESRLRCLRIRAGEAV